MGGSLRRRKQLAGVDHLGDWSGMSLLSLGMDESPWDELDDLFGDLSSSLLSRRVR